MQTGSGDDHALRFDVRGRALGSEKGGLVTMDRGPSYRHGFPESDWETAKEQARQAMVKRARRGRTMTYTDLCSEIEAISFDPHDPRLPHFLGQISTEEDAAGRGMLTAVVVHKHDGQPGKGFYDLARKLGRSVLVEEETWIAELGNLENLYGGGA